MKSDQLLRFVRVRCDELDPGPLPVPFQDSTMGPFMHWKLGWLRLTTDDGIEGQAPTTIPESIAQTLLSEGPLTPQQWWHRLFWMQRNAGHRNPATSGLLYGLDMVFRDILAQRAGLPWHRYMGATRDSVPVYGSGGGTNRPIDELVEEMRAMVRDGFTIVKMKVGMHFGTRMDEDLRRVRAVREAIGDKIGLAIDANQVWSADQARAFAEQVAELRIAWFEEPVHSADRAALRALCRDCPIPVAMGESENHWLGFREMKEIGVPHLQPNPHCLPGFDRWMDAVAFTESGNERVPRDRHATYASPFPRWTAGGFSHLTAMYLATRPTESGAMVEYLRGIIGHLATCLKDKPRIERGMIHLDDEHGRVKIGLPVSVDWPRLRGSGAVRMLMDLHV